MQSLEEMRKELDVIDDQITTLYDERYLIRQERTRNWQQ